MILNTSFPNTRSESGNTLIELAIILPVLLLLALGIVDFGRAIQFNNILVSISREGGSLASRTTEPPQNIIAALINTAQPLDMPSKGMMYITEIMGQKIDSDCVGDCAIYPLVRAQTRALTGDNSLPSRVWSCPTLYSNSNGGCVNSSSWANSSQSRPVLPVTLSDGEVIYAVETIYDYPVIVRFVMKSGPELYSLTVL